MEKKMETTIIMGYMGDYRVYIGVIEGLYRDNGKENGNHHLGFRI